MSYELMQIETIKRRRQNVVKEVGRVVFKDSLQLGLQQALILVIAGVQFTKEAEQSACLCSSGLSIRRAVDMKEHDLSDHLPDMPTRKSVVTNEPDTLGG